MALRLELGQYSPPMTYLVRYSNSEARVTRTIRPYEEDFAVDTTDVMMSSPSRVDDGHHHRQGTQAVQGRDQSTSTVASLANAIVEIGTVTRSLVLIVGGTREVAKYQSFVSSINYTTSHSNARMAG